MFNIIGLKCPACGSYNTRRMGLHTTTPPPPGGPGGEQGGAGHEASKRKIASPALFCLREAEGMPHEPGLHASVISQ